MKNMVKRVEKLEETGRYVVKVADSCPLAIEQQRHQSKLSRGNHPLSEQENEKLRLERMKKQAFLEKIQRELKDKEKSNLIKKKVAAQQALNNIDDLMVINSDEETEF